MKLVTIKERKGVRFDPSIQISFEQVDESLKSISLRDKAGNIIKIVANYATVELLQPEVQKHPCWVLSGTIGPLQFTRHFFDEPSGAEFMAELRDKIPSPSTNLRMERLELTAEEVDRLVNGERVEEEAPLLSPKRLAEMFDPHAGHDHANDMRGTLA